jgi:hypothetical protein
MTTSAGPNSDATHLAPRVDADVVDVGEAHQRAETPLT